MTQAPKDGSSEPFAPSEASSTAKAQSDDPFMAFEQSPQHKVRVSSCMQLCTCMYIVHIMRPCVYTCTCTCTCTVCMYVYVYVHVIFCMYIYVCVYNYCILYMCVWLGDHVYIHVRYDARVVLLYSNLVLNTYKIHPCTF